MERGIAVANDETLSAWIGSAQRRLVLLAPAVTTAVARALIERWRSLLPDAVSIILDMDPEVYRLGYGDPEALDLLEREATKIGRALHKQPGTRIGLLLVDDQMIVYSPAPRLIEAGPPPSGPQRPATDEPDEPALRTDSAPERVEVPSAPLTPNAIVLGPPPETVAAELGQGPKGETDQTVGTENTAASDIEHVRADLQRNPPRRFDLARIERVFNAHFEFVEFELKGVSLEKREVQIPADFLGFAPDEETRGLFKASVRILDAADKISGKEIHEAKRRIQSMYLKSIRGYGSVIPRKDKPAFAEEVKLLRSRVESFKKDVLTQLREVLDRRRAKLLDVLRPRIQKSPPAGLTRADGSPPTPDMVDRWLEHELGRAFERADRLVDDMEVKVIYKGVTYDSLVNPAFITAAREAMPELRELHEEHEAARLDRP